MCLCSKLYKINTLNTILLCDLYLNYFLTDALVNPLKMKVYTFVAKENAL